MRTEYGINIFKSESELKEYTAKIMESQSEISKVLSAGVSPDKIIYANPIKDLCHLKYAAKRGVRMMTFDSVFELDKTKEHCPQAKMVLRIKADALDATVVFGEKFGYEPELAMELVHAALDRNLEVVGISFHVGSGCREFTAYARAIHIACKLIRECKEINVYLSFLDIGGGFSPTESSHFAQACKLIKEALEEEKDTLAGIRIIAEPGKYLVCNSFKLYTVINGLKKEKEKIEYYINQGVYGAFTRRLNIEIYKNTRPIQITNIQGKGPLKNSRIWGQTCQDVDLVAKELLLPEMKVGEWLEFSEMGGYTISLASTSNGFELPKEHYVVSEETWSRMVDYFRQLEDNEKSDV